jgi:hypothetical protein
LRSTSTSRLQASTAISSSRVFSRYFMEYYHRSLTLFVNCIDLQIPTRLSEIFSGDSLTTTAVSFEDDLVFHRWTFVLAVYAVILIISLVFALFIIAIMQVGLNSYFCRFHILI